MTTSIKGALDGRVVLVTGAGGGIGREVALLCAREGARVLVNDLGVSIAGEGHDTGPATGVVAEIRSAGGMAFANDADVADPAAAEAMVDDAKTQLGGLDAVSTTPGSCATRFSTR